MKKLFSMVLAFILMFSTLPSAFAANEAPTKGSLTIHKYAHEKDGQEGEAGTGEPGQKIPEGATPIEGVEYEVIQIASFELITKDGEIVKEGEKEVKNATPIKDKTGKDGTVKFDNLPIGRYLVKEISGPTNVNLNTDPYTIEIPMTDKEGKKLNYDVHIYPKNEIKRGAVELTKTDDAGKPLENVEFTLYHKGTDKVVVDKAGKELKDLKTDKDGKIRVDGLLHGEYYFKESKALPGYVLDPKHREFKIEKSGAFPKDGQAGYGEIVKLDTIINYKKPTIDKKINGNLNGLPINVDEEFTYDIKTTLPGDIHKYKKYVITDNVDPKLTIIGTPVVTIDGEKVSSDVVKVTLGEKTAAGQLVTVTVENFKALEGKKELHLQIKAKVNGDINGGTEIKNIAKIDYETGDEVTPPDDETTTPPVTVIVTDGKISLKKIDGATKDALEGAKFELRKDGKVVKVKGVDVVGVSDKDGMIKWENIPYGEYEIVEIEAPKYTDKGEVKSYQKLREPIKVKIDKDNQTVKLTVENNKSGWILPATGGIGTILFTVVGLVLMGAAFMFLRRKA
ncbi:MULTISPECIES: SpaH/EbpB family LPXTG-anchored major pilin [Bacillus cereus group]|uniref:SpaH/EbpB family LPXTG-anchored major pilin n=1 Tax=Bacillus cereus group TaxID=86661 RepID=UPI0000E89F9C|nr:MULTISPECIES: SpaH/EbpB family LPXTG-anchored major pilin [Bacillus cereus group]HDR7334386.1 SpaH/EbpB family LPXTG-anchored major pilin [Bacillus anthracis]ABK87901.1 surface protein, LPXTG-motif cell wall anchor domain protein [Bacillus thuringiensis str. Al Hakam]AJH67409.1 fimbrial isopeptide formation D2 domain protein [Bacillus thuringiensis]MBL3877552.1 SpaH/EbpB family LPXTG-anchored major pilin [Bacillus cereus]MCE7037537.1 SpaH/EbpB family LPXTG-anchored major pilin [Bacillus cer